MNIEERIFWNKIFVIFRTINEYNVIKNAPRRRLKKLKIEEFRSSRLHQLRES